MSGSISPKLTTIANFDYTNGGGPNSSVIADANGDLFGTTEYGGASGVGVVFEIKRTNGIYDSQPTTLLTFNGANGATPTSGLFKDANGDLFGTTFAGGANGVGTVFEIPMINGSYASTPTTLVTFDGTNGTNPEVTLVADAAGNLFGTTRDGGAHGDGTVFEIKNIDGTYASSPITLVNFNGTDGSNGYAGLLIDANGNLFGASDNGGTSNDGVVYEVKCNNGTYDSNPDVLVNFNGVNGSIETETLYEDAQGNLFGDTFYGGASNDGTVFEIKYTNGVYSSTPITIVSFDGTNGSNPSGSLLMDASGNLFGVTLLGGANGDGTVFEIPYASGAYASTPSTLISFNGANGARPTNTMLSDTNGDLFGTTTSYGGSGDSGTVFEITGTNFVPIAPVVSSPTLTATENAVATAIGIAAPTDPNYSAGQLSIVVGSLPTDGGVTLSDGTTAITSGETLTVAQLTGLEFKPTTGAFNQSSTLTYSVTDPASNSATGTATLKIGPPSAPPSSHASDSIYLAGYGNTVTSPTAPATNLGPLIITAIGYGNTIIGNDGNDIITAGAGAAHMTVSDADGNNIVTGSQGNTSVRLGNGNNTIDLGGYANTITLGDGANVVTAGAGNDTVDIAGGTGTIHAAGWGDVFDFGDGEYVLGNMSGNASVTLNWSSSKSSLDLQGTAGDSFENRNGELIVTSMNGATYAVVQSTNQATFGFTSDGQGGTIVTLGGNGIVGPLVPSPLGRSTITETHGGVTLDIGSGDRVVNLAGYGNTVMGEGGNVTISGDQGGSTFQLGNGSDTLNLSGYGDRVVLGNGDSTVRGIQGNGTVTVGNAGTTGGTITLAGYGNTITTGGGSWTIVAGAGNDTVNTQAGNDTVTLAGWGNTVTAGTGFDQVSGGFGNSYKLTALSSSGGFNILDFNASSGDVLNLSGIISGLAPGWLLTGSVDSHDPSALDVNISSGGSSYQLAALHGVGDTSLATLITSQHVLT